MRVYGQSDLLAGRLRELETELQQSQEAREAMEQRAQELARRQKELEQQGRLLGEERLALERERLEVLRAKQGVLMEKVSMSEDEPRHREGAERRSYRKRGDEGRGRDERRRYGEKM